MLNTPILFIVFNRIDTARRVFNTIKQAKPRRLYIACDGPRKNRPEEKVACQQTRDLVDQVNWECDVFTMFLEDNLGPSKGPYSFIKWFFSKEEQGIILEHDCLPHPDFFFYCEELLNKYKNTPQIGAISGPNFVSESHATNSYTYTIYNHIWGWATWRRTIDKYSLDLSMYSKQDLNKILNLYFTTQIEKLYWKTIFKQIKKGEIPTWDYYLTFCLWFNQLLSISPNKNLVSNIGFGEGAVNTTDAKSPLANRETYPILPLIDNSTIEQNKQQEQNYFKEIIMENKSTFRLYIKIIFKQIGIFYPLMRLLKS